MFTLVKDEPDQHIYQYGSLCLNIHWDLFHVVHLQSISDVCDMIVKQHNQLSSVVILRGEVNFDLSAETRRAAATMTTRFERYNLGQAVIIESDGFRASMARSVITAINLFARSRAPQRVFQDPREAMQWVCSLPKQPPEIRNGVAPLWTAFDRLLKERSRRADETTPLTP